MDNIILEGSISVKAALEAGRREIFEICTDGRHPDRNRAYILRLAHAAKIPVNEYSKEHLDNLTSGSSHGGIAARAGERRYQTMGELLSEEHPFFALLDGIEDPYNFGGALRSLCAAGVNGVLVPERNWCSADNVVTKASAGASERLPILPVTDWGMVLTGLRQRGIRILCAERRNAISLYDADMTGKVLLVFGGELRGISAKILAYADQCVFIPYGSDFRNALSANSAAAVFAFEALRQRMKSIPR